MKPGLGSDLRFSPRKRASRQLTPGWSATLPEPPDDSGWFDSDAIVDRLPNSLLAAKVSLGRLSRDMSQKELDLLQFAS
jgi:hypothetical protein